MRAKDIQSEEFTYTLYRTPRRRSISIYVDTGGIIVRAPSRMSVRRVRAFVESKSAWITKKQAEIAQRDAQRPAHRYAEGEIFSYLGNLYRLKPESAKKNHTIIRGEELVVGLKEGSPPEKIPEILEKWYIARARERFTERVSLYSAILGLSPARISVRGQKRRWGSCSSKGNINLNWKLITGPPEILDYVVAHELCHLRHRNHSPAFWSELERVFPNYRECRKWLRENGHKLGV